MKARNRGPRWHNAFEKRLIGREENFAVHIENAKGVVGRIAVDVVRQPTVQVEDEAVILYPRGLSDRDASISM